MRSLVRLFPLICCAIAVFGAQPASAEKRGTLVIGNAEYQLTRFLLNPAAKLSRDNGFTGENHLVPSAYKRELMVLVGPVTGAPGDGGTSLRRAIRRQLVARGVTVATSSSLPGYRIDGFVTMTGELKGEQLIFIQWLVTDPQGDRLGTVDQRNNVRKGSLDGKWGLVADQAAEAAVRGIMKLLPPP